MRKYILAIFIFTLMLGVVGAGVYIRGTSAPDFIIDYDNTGAGANTRLIFERGSSGDDATLSWDESADTFSLSQPLAGLKTVGPGYDVTAYGASGSTTTTTGSITVGTPTLTVASASSFEVGNGVMVTGAGASGYSDTAPEDDTDQDLSTTGNDDDLEWIGRKFNADATGIVGSIIIELGKTGSPDGTLTVSIYSDDGEATSMPDTQIGGSSGTVNCADLSADASGANQTFNWAADHPAVVSGTDYWVVLKSTGYTYSDGVTEVRWRTDANGGVGLDECAKYEADADPAWTSVGGDVGADADVQLNLISTISTVSGTTITLGDNAGNTVSSLTVLHDDYTAVNNAHTAATASGGLMIFPTGTYNITTNLTINSDVALYFYSGASLSISGNLTATIEGHIRDTIFQIFKGYGSVVGSPTNDFVRPEWWGAIGNNSTDCSTAIDKAIKFASALTSDIQVVQFLPGEYLCNSAFSYDGTHDNITLQGAGQTETTWARIGGTTIRSNINDGTTPLFSLIGTVGNYGIGWNVRDIQFISNATYAQCAFKVEYWTNFVMENCDVRRFTDYGVWLNGNNWSNKFDEVSINLDGSGTGIHGTTWLTTIQDCNITNCEYAIRLIGNTIHILNCDVESSDKGYYNSGGAGVQGLTILGMYFESMGTDDVIEGKIINGFFAANREGASNDLSLTSGSTSNYIAQWYGDITLSGTTYNTLIGMCQGTVTGLSDANCNYVMYEGQGAGASAGWTMRFLEKDGGVVGEYLQQYLMSVVDDSGTPTYGSELLTNTTFDANTDDWTDVRATLTSIAGGQSNNCLKVDNDANNGIAYQAIATDPGAMYYFTGYYKKVDTSCRVYIGTTVEGTDLGDSGVLTETSWTQVTITFTAQTTTTYITLMSVGASGNENYFDEVSVKRINSGDLGVGNSISAGGDVNVGGDISATGGFKQTFSFGQGNVAASQSTVQLDVLGQAGNEEYVMPYAGSVIAVSVASNDARSAGTLTVDATVNGTATGLQAVLDGSNTTYHYGTQAKDSDTFSAGDRLGVEITTDVGWLPTTADIVVMVTVEM